MSRFLVRKSQQVIKEIQLSRSKTYTVGRKEDCDIVLDADPGISREHFTLTANEEGQWTVKCHSEHTLLGHDGRGKEEIICEDSPTHFDLLNYSFELIFETSVEVEALFEDELSLDKESDNSPSQAKDSDNPPSENSFVGNEEKTEEVHLRGEPYLKFTYSSHVESIRLKGNKWTAGRDSIAQVFLDDKKASRQHFTMEKVGNIFFIKDLGSSNGTLLNGQELKPNASTQIKSGDIITVNQLTMIFEIRDLSFSQKLGDLPLQAYNGPMILASDSWGDSGEPPRMRPPATGANAGPLTNEALAQLPGTVAKVDPPKQPNKMRFLLFAAIAVIGCAVVFSNNDDKKKTTDLVASNVKTFQSLDEESKKFIIQTYAYGQELYRDDKFQLSMTELEKIHQILPYYKESKELYAKAEQALETLRQMEFIKEQQRVQQETKVRAAELISDCKRRFINTYDLAGAKSCLSEPSQLDPGHPDINTITSTIEFRIQQAEEDKRKQREYDEAVDSGVQLYVKAKNLHKNRKLHKAISAYSAHMNSNYPDPDRLKRKSKRKIASIEYKIRSEKKRYLGSAYYQRRRGNLKRAILMAEKAKKIDPFDYEISNLIFKAKKSLKQKMRKIYTDSVIEEKFGNLELSKKYWRQIIKQDVPSGDYYLKAKRKLQLYGLSQ